MLRGRVGKKRLPISQQMVELKVITVLLLQTGKDFLCVISSIL